MDGPVPAGKTAWKCAGAETGAAGGGDRCGTPAVWGAVPNG
jgi:hypothetical protein